jgi:hypothetical protein
MKRNLILFSQALLLLVSFSSQSYADVVITDRLSLLSTTIDFGYVGNVLTTTDSLISTLIDNTQLNSQASASDGGALGDISWDASYQYSLDQQLDPGSSTGFGGSSSTSLFAFYAGDGVSHLASTNRLEVIFENSEAANFVVDLNATDTSNLYLDQMATGGIWNNLLALSGGFSIITTPISLPTGIYRLIAETNVNTDNGFGNGSWSYSIIAVPEPSSMGLLAISTSWLIIGRRRMAL